MASGYCVVKIEGAATGRQTPHDGNYVVKWNPHTRFGTIGVTSTADRTKATVFPFVEAFETWRAISRVQPVRHDSKPNRPLTALHVTFEDAPPN